MLDHLSVVILRQRCRTGVWKCVVVVSHNELQFFSNQKVEIILEEANIPESCLAKTYLKWKLSNISTVLWKNMLLAHNSIPLKQ